MRTYLKPMVAGALAVGATAVIAVSVGGQARALESFTLGQHDHLLAESAGCRVECRAMGTNRTCVINDYDCRAVCMDVPECSQGPGRMMPRVCAVVRTHR